MAFSPSASTPKRKRDTSPSPSSIPFSFDVSHLSSATTENSNINNLPHFHAKVAHKFRGLALEGEGRGRVSSSPPPSDDDFGAARKRARVDETTAGTPGASCQVNVVDGDGNQVTRPDMPLESTDFAAGRLQHSYPSINRLSESKSRGKKRSGTPPLRLRKGPVHNVADDGDEDEEDEEMEIVDPVRASLTWHEHEITVYDPEDEDDDGTGINGIGFKPTPALAHARTLKRKQQLAEYKRREDMDARAKRSRRRSTAVNLVVGPLDEESESSRKVRFTIEEDHSQAVIT